LGKPIFNMILRFILPLFLLFQSMDAQEYDLKASSIPEALKENADAVIRLDKVDITIASVKSTKVGSGLWMLKNISANRKRLNL
jgi:hypothetical protein